MAQPGPIKMQASPYRRGELPVTVLLSPEDKTLAQFRWRLDNAGHVIRWYTHNGQREQIYLKRAVAGAFPGRLVNTTVQHVNGNKLDNRRENLRIMEQVQAPHGGFMWRRRIL